MKCIILAAGYATHLYPLTLNFPKPLLEVAGKPVLDWLVDDLATEIDEFVVVSNHKYAQSFDKWAAEKPFKITVLDDGTSSNETRLGAVKDIAFAVEQDGICGDCLVMAGDNLLDFSLRKFTAFAREKGTSCVMCYRETRPEVLHKSAVITEHSDGLITSMQEKSDHPRGHLVVPAFYYYKEQDIRRITEALAEGCGYDAPGSFAAWLSRRVPMYAYMMPGMRHDIGNLESYEMTRKTYKGIILS